MNINTGISIIMNRWLGISRSDVVHVITDEFHPDEADAFRAWAEAQDAALKVTVLKASEIQEGSVIESMAGILEKADLIIGASDNSFITTQAVTQAVNSGARFLSLPLSCNDGTSLLESNWLDMDPEKCKAMALPLLEALDAASSIRTTTTSGTNLLCLKRGRKSGFFNGAVEKHRRITSASFEVYVPIEENSTQGTLVLDGSLGYIGLVEQPIHISFDKGRMRIEDSHADALKLLRYTESFADDRMFYPGEYGIGLNTVSRCRGISYIEDESAYGTFHLGLGRNISLGGVQQASGHFDIVTHKPTIWADDVLIMKDGEITHRPPYRKVPCPAET